MKAITYEIERWIEIRFQRAAFEHRDRWYIVNRLTENGPADVEYLTESGKWDWCCPKFFTTPRSAEKFWHKTAELRK